MAEHVRSQENGYKTVYTTGEAAKVCQVSQQTIIRCFDSGALPGFRVPGSRFRRIPRDVLYRFMKENGIPTDAMESPNENNKLGMLVSAGVLDAIKILLDTREDTIQTVTYSDSFELGIACKQGWPNTIAIDDRVIEPPSMDSIGRKLCELHDDTVSDVRSIAILSRGMQSPAFDEIIDTSVGGDIKMARRIIDFHTNGEDE